MSAPAAWPQCSDFFGPLLVIEPSPGQPSADAGLLPIRQFDQRIGLTRAFATALDDPRDPDLIDHTFLKMVRVRPFRVSGRGETRGRAGGNGESVYSQIQADPFSALLAPPVDVPDGHGPLAVAHAGTRSVTKERRH